MKTIHLGHPPTLKLQVTEEIIAAATQRNSNHCMIAEAVKQARPELSRVAVDIQTIRASNRARRERYVWLTPRCVQQAIVDFDQGNSLLPFAVALREGQTVSMEKRTYTKEERVEERRRVKAYRRNRLRAPAKGNHTNVPVRVGGRTPPKAMGARRAFGLRSLKY